MFFLVCNALKRDWLYFSVINSVINVLVVVWQLGDNAVVE